MSEASKISEASKMSEVSNMSEASKICEAKKMSEASKMHIYLASLGRSQWVNLGRKHFDGFLGDFNDSLILSPSVPALKVQG